MNELLFFAHIGIITLFTIVALKISKETLVTTVGIYCILANLFVLKQIKLFGLQPTASDAFSVGAILGLNLLQEYFGEKITKKAIWTCFFALVLYAVVSHIHLLYIPSVCDISAGHYNFILKSMPRIAIASILVTLLVQHIDRIFYGFLKQKFHNKYFLARNLLSLFIIQLIDTILFTFAGLWGIVNNLWDIILVSFIVKLVTILVSVPMVAIFKPKTRI